MKLNLKIVIMLFFLISPLLSAEQGTIDLRAIDLSSEVVELEGDWEFYWAQLIDPGENPPHVSEYMSVPDQWNSSGKYTTMGYATYRTKILLPQIGTPLALFIPFTYNRYKLFVNDRLLAEQGDVSSEFSENYNRQTPLFYILPDMDVIEITYQVSNFDDLHGGIMDSPKVGTNINLNRERNRATIFEAFLFGALFITGMLYLSFYINKRDDGSTLYFGLFSLIMAIRTILYGEHIMLQIFSSLSMELETAMGHITFYLALPLFLRFITMAYPLTKVKKLRFPVNIISGVYIFIAVFTDHFFYVRFLFAYQIVALITGGAIIICLVDKALKKNSSAQVTLLGFVALLGSAVNDILYSQDILVTFHMVPLGVAFFLMSQASLMSWNIGLTFRQSEDLASELTIANRSFRRFVPEEFLQYLKRERIADIKLGDHVQLDMTVLFCDIRDFTSMSENMTPHENFLFLNSFLERIGPVIRKNNGFVDKYIGDGVMALFPGDADSAVSAAIEIQDALSLYNKHRANSGYKSIHIGVGINTGSLMLGTIGENERMDSTVISDAVNVCSRIESITKEYGLKIALSGNTVQRLKHLEDLNLRNIGRVILKGKKEPVPVFELYNCDDSIIIMKKNNFKLRFEEAVMLFEEKKYEKALKAFSNILEVFPEDETCLRFQTNIVQSLNNLIE